MIPAIFALTFGARSGPEQYLEDFLKQSRVPGIAAYARVGGGQASVYTFGLADIESKKPIDKSMVFDAGSISKTFTSVVTLKLAELGNLRLSDELGKYVPNVPDEWKPITIRQLLSHTSGLPEYVLYPGIMLTDDFDTPKWFEVMADKPLDFKPGTEFDYSNTNFFMLKLVDEKAAGRTMDSLLRTYVWDPAGMKSTGRPEDLKSLTRATGYWVDQEIEPIGPAGKSPDDGSGSHLTTVDDLAKFVDALFDGKLIDERSLSEMTTQTSLPKGRKAPYGLGLFIRQINGITVLSHGGNSVGYAGSITYIPQFRATITLLGNAYQMNGDSVALGLARQLFSELIPKELVEHPDSDKELSQQLVDLLKQLAKGDLSNPLLSAELKAKYSRPRGQMSLAGFAPFAAAEYAGFYGSEPSDPDTLRRVGIKMGDRMLVATFTVDVDGRVFAISVTPAPPRK